MPDHVIDLGLYSEENQGQTVTIRGSQSWAARKRIASSGAVIHSGQQDKAVEGFETSIDLLEQALVKLETAIIDWTYLGATRPPTRATFLADDFDPDFGDWLLDQIDEYYESKKRKPEDRKG